MSTATKHPTFKTYKTGINLSEDKREKLIELLNARLADSLEADLQKIREAANLFSRRPRTFFEEWDSPLISGIQWVEELVEIAGGEPIFPELRATILLSLGPGAADFGPSDAWAGTFQDSRFFRIDRD